MLIDITRPPVEHLLFGIQGGSSETDMDVLGMEQVDLVVAFVHHRIADLTLLW